MVKFVGAPLEIPDALTSVQAVRKQVTDGLNTRVTALETSVANTGWTFVSKTAAYTAVANNFVLATATSGGFTVTLPASPTTNTVVAVKKVDTSANLVTVVGSGATTIDTAASFILSIPQSGAEFRFDGTNWRVENGSLYPNGWAYKGTWTSGTAYQVNDTVYYNGFAYIAVAANTSNNPTPVMTTPWQKLTYGYNFRATYATGTTYYPGDVVVLSGHTWLATSGSSFISQSPNNTTGFWTKMVQGFNYVSAPWGSGNTYLVGDVVFYTPTGGAYVCILGGSTGVAPGNTSVWTQLTAGGAAATITAGTATTLAFGATPTVTNVGTSNAAQFNFGIPAGQPGVSFTFKGAFAINTAYAINDVVTYGGNSFIALTAVTSANTTPPPTDTSNATWSLMTLHGSNGTNGTNGSSFNFRSTWAVGTAYAINDTVTYNGTTYTAVAASTGTTPTTAMSTPWKAVAQGLYERLAYSNATTYYPGDIVYYLNSSWMAINPAGISGSPPNPGNSVNWAAMTRGYNYIGVWSSVYGTYYPGDVVNNNGYAYVNLAQSTTAAPTGAATSNASWGLLANKGDPATISAGAASTTTVVPGTNAAVNNTGTTTNATFTFTIPRGSTWSSGTPVPGAGSYGTGDMYLKTDTYDLYQYSAGAWTIVANIKGTTGTTGTRVRLAQRRPSPPVRSPPPRLFRAPVRRSPTPAPRAPPRSRSPSRAGRRGRRTPRSRLRGRRTVPGTCT
jgi:hypothetical protein